MLRELVEHMKAHDGVWYATHGEIADHVRLSAGLDGWARRPRGGQADEISLLISSAASTTRRARAFSCVSS